MKRALIILSISLAVAPLAYSQNIFDDDALETPEVKPPKKPAKVEKDSGEKPVVKASKKKRKGKKKKKAATKEVASSGTSYSPEALGRASYAWAPESEPVTLTTISPGMKTAALPPQIKSVAVAMKPEIIDEKIGPKEGGSFKLPQIPLTQVLIVAGFVILFLIYRFRVGRQIKRKRY